MYGVFIYDYGIRIYSIYMLGTHEALTYLPNAPPDLAWTG